MGKRWSTAIVIVLLLGSTAQAAVLCATKKGAVKLRSETCKPKETALDPIALGLQGPKGDKGDQGDPGEPGGGTVGSATIAQSLGGVALGATNVPVAATKSTDAPPTSGAWYGALEVPTTDTVVMVMAHVTTDGVDGYVDCDLESSTNEGAYSTIATRSTADRELFFNETFPSFVVGTAIQFRVSCRITAGVRNVVAANIGAIGSSAGILD